MAKKKLGKSFSKATLTMEDGKLILTEYDKEDVRRYNFVEEFKEYLNEDNLKISISKDEDF